MLSPHRVRTSFLPKTSVVPVATEVHNVVHSHEVDDLVSLRFGRQAHDPIAFVRSAPDFRFAARQCAVPEASARHRGRLRRNMLSTGLMISNIDPNRPLPSAEHLFDAGFRHVADAVQSRIVGRCLRNIGPAIAQTSRSRFRAGLLSY
jgi:hypothetical protein